MAKNKILLAEPTINSKETVILTKKILDNNFPNEGKLTKLFEKKLSRLLKVKYVVTATSGTISIFLALKAAGVKRDDEVIIPNITFPATANAVVLAGAKPVLVDIDKKSLLINEKSLIKKINKRTKAIIPVHVSGRGSNIKNILKIAKNKKLIVIEDAAESFMSKINGKYLGTFGEAGCFSFAPNKIITTGQGGAVVTNNKNIYKKLKILKDQGRVGPTTGGEDKYVSNGYNFKFTNLQASLGLSQIKNIEWRKKKLNQIHNYYLKNINQNKYFKIIKFEIKNGETPLWTDVWCANRDKLYKFLKGRNVVCRYYWKPLNVTYPYLKSFSGLKESKKLQKKLMWLPSSLNMSIADQKKVCNLINSFYS